MASVALERTARNCLNLALGKMVMMRMAGEDVDRAEYLISSGWDLITNLTLWSCRSR